MKYLLPLLLFCGLAQAQVTCPKVSASKAHVCWTAVVTGKDGDGATVAISGATYTVQLQSGSTWNNVATALTATDWTSATLAPGSYTYRVLAVYQGTSGAPTTSAMPKDVAVPVPDAPGSVVIAQATFDVQADETHLTWVRGRMIGLAKLGAACEPNCLNDSYCKLSRPSRVVLSRPSRSTVMVAKCASQS